MSDTRIRSYSSGQLTALALLRITIGWHFLYEGVVKLMNPNWSSVGYLMDSKGLLSGIFHNLAANPNLLQLVDFLNVWGLTLIGLGLILGLFTNISAISGMVLLAFYYLSHPPLIDVSYAIPSEGSYLFVNKNLIEMIALGAILMFPTGYYVGLDRYIFRK